MPKSSLGQLEEKVAALLCYFPWIALIISIIVIIVEKQSRYVLFHGYQSLFVILFYIIIAILLGIIDSFIGIVTGVSILSTIWALLYLVVWIFLMVTAYTRAETGNPVMIPLLGGWAASLADKRFAGGSSVAPAQDYTAPPPKA
eukprot:TRINITY_DN22002_c0_g1_i1.p1 TRINITY_DN22002_c0_g1~~TRINITY_DN22002_c0_g1_i1.p1  ORF type:complete len:144 (+),score=15.89 TRINITY_DN22002_c0_g1_i1:48-479(+)